eukprot:CAMPEP_0113879856 /NCGR_PEP_ID=MMETSP0780_2-20120614/7463_1 /TAXON_ID=652834 /ORGANISM="Palpitomonas bilix" /LENGTH=51 /DNA_ID=CAMNT_0000866469 /DNA_START=71 /DNA_END=226 /DNA_ORIENTATION=- /assembly_acc=CAM_ASM_000599
MEQSVLNEEAGAYNEEASAYREEAAAEQEGVDNSHFGYGTGGSVSGGQESW